MLHRGMTQILSNEQIICYIIYNVFITYNKCTHFKHMVQSLTMSDVVTLSSHNEDQNTEHCHYPKSSLLPLLSQSLLFLAQGNHFLISLTVDRISYKWNHTEGTLPCLGLFCSAQKCKCGSIGKRQPFQQIVLEQLSIQREKIKAQLIPHSILKT